MNKSAIKNFAIWARNKLIADISYRAGLMGITAEGISTALPQSTMSTEFYDIGTENPYSISGDAIKQRRKLVEVIRRKEEDTDYQAAYKYIIEEVAYTWFNRLIAIRFMEVNDYLPSHIRVLSSETGKLEPDIVTNPFDAEPEFTDEEREKVIQLKTENQLDELFRILFIKQCNALNEYLPALFEKTNDYTELLLNISVIDQDGVVYKLIHDISEDDFNIEKGGQIEIIGWLYQYYNTEPKAEVFGRPSGTKIRKEDVPAATQLFTPDWIVRYMVENSLGRLWVEGHPNDELKANWKYYLEEAAQEPEVEEKLAEIRKEYAKLNPEDIKLIDPCMGSGHILVYAFDVLMQIYESAGYGQRDAARSILENNIYGLDIDDRAFQLAYFAVMMKARQYNRRILTGEHKPNLYSIKESNGVNRAHIKYFGMSLSEADKEKAVSQINSLLDIFIDAKEYGSILTVEEYDWELLERFIEDSDSSGQISMETVGIEDTKESLSKMIAQGKVLGQKYWVTVTNPPYLGGRNQNDIVLKYITERVEEGKADLYSAFIMRCNLFTRKNGYRAMITQHSWMFLSSFEKLRKRELDFEIVNMIHLGARAFDEISGEVVQTTTWVLKKVCIDKYIAKYFRLLKYCGEREKEKAYLERKDLYNARKDKYYKLPGLPIAYWFCNTNIFKQGNSLESIANPRQGLKTLDNEYYLKLWFEVKAKDICFNAKSIKEAKDTNKKWFPINHGGDFRQYYGNNSYVVNWRNDGEEMKAFAIKKYKSITRTITNISYYFKSGITWSVLCSSPSFRRYDEGFIFSNGGQCIVPDDPSVDLDYLTGFLNSNVAKYILNILSPTLGFESGYVKKLPVIWGNDDDCNRASELSKENIRIAKCDWDQFETSWDFVKHPLVNYDTEYTSLLRDKYESWISECKDRVSIVKKNKVELNKLYMKIYNMECDIESDVKDKEVSIYSGDIKNDIKSLLSYAVGCMFGRYSLNSDGLIDTGGIWNEKSYGTFSPNVDNIIPITDEEYFECDIVSRFSTWLKYVYGESTLEENLEFIANVLGGKGNSSRNIIRNYFLNEFFKDHCSVYTFASSGKRPIYWLFDSGKQNGFKALIYLHRYNADTIGNLRIDYLHRMQRIYESESSRMQDTIEHSTNAREVATATKRREKLQKQLKECREYDEKIAHLALSRIELDLDDGVKVNYRKLQTAVDGKFYEVLADSKNIMSKK